MPIAYSIPPPPLPSGGSHYPPPPSTQYLPPEGYRPGYGEDPAYDEFMRKHEDWERRNKAGHHRSGEHGRRSSRVSTRDSRDSRESRGSRESRHGSSRRSKSPSHQKSRSSRSRRSHSRSPPPSSRVSKDVSRPSWFCLHYTTWCYRVAKLSMFSPQKLNAFSIAQKSARGRTSAVPTTPDPAADTSAQPSAKDLLEQRMRMTVQEIIEAEKKVRTGCTIYNISYTHLINHNS